MSCAPEGGLTLHFFAFPFRLVRMPAPFYPAFFISKRQENSKKHLSPAQLRRKKCRVNPAFFRIVATRAHQQFTDNKSIAYSPFIQKPLLKQTVSAGVRARRQEACISPINRPHQTSLFRFPTWRASRPTGVRIPASRHAHARATGRAPDSPGAIKVKLKIFLISS